MAPPTVTSAPPVGAPPSTPPGFDGTRGAYTGEGAPVYTAATPTSPLQMASYVLRLVAAVLAFVAAVVMGVARQTKWWVSTDTDIIYKQTYYTTGMSQLQYFIAANAIVCAYAAITLGIAATYKAGSPRATALVIAMTDGIAIALLFAAIGSAAAINVLARLGATGTWDSICSAYGRFCGQMAGAIAMSSLSGVALLGLLFLTLTGIHQGTLGGKR